MVEGFFEREFGWVPASMVDVGDIARERGLNPSISALAKSLVGGKYCRRGRNFTDISLPSSVAMRHRDMDVSIVYEYYVKACDLRGQEMSDNLRDHDRRKRERDESGDRGPSRSRPRR